VGNDLVESVPLVDSQALEVVKGDIAEEVEEGEIASNSNQKSVQGEKIQEEGDWLTVSSSGGKSTNQKSGRTLTYGQVCIASPSRYAILSNIEDDSVLEEVQNEDSVGKETEDSVKGVLEVVVVEGKEEMALNKTQQVKSGFDGASTRVSIPRSSKKAHKFVSVPNQKATDVLPRQVSKKNNKRFP